MRLKQSRAASFVAVALIYIAACVAGILIYNALPFGFVTNLLIADIAATIIVFVFSVILKNASVYDPYWSVQPMVIAVAFSVSHKATVAGVLILVAIVLWGIRLTANWAYTFRGLEFQDWRYTMLHNKTGKAYPFINFTGIHLVPTLVVYGCILPAVFVLVYTPKWNIGSIIFFAVSVLAFVMQGVADVQMHIFHKKKQRGEISDNFIRTGLWKYSRHPNYLGEVIMWWGVALAAVSVMPQRWYLVAGAAANTVLFLLVSIPMAEGKQSSKEGYAQYKKETRMLLPIKKIGY